MELRSSRISPLSDPIRSPFPIPLFLPSLLLFLLLLLPTQQASVPSHTQKPMSQRRPPVDAGVIARRPSYGSPKVGAPRPRRQSRPREGLFQVYWRLMNEASNDTGSAFTQIRQLFSTLIEPSNGMSENLQSADNATTESTIEAEGGVNSTTTTEAAPRRISSGELMTIFRRNVVGLGRLFGREFWNAIQQSNKNVEMYTSQWQDALRPYLE